MSDLFTMFSDAMPESMKKQEKELKKQKEKKATKTTSGKKNTPTKPSIPEEEKKQIILPVVVYYAREKLVLEYDPDDEIILKNVEKLKEEEQKKQDSPDAGSEVTADDTTESGPDKDEIDGKNDNNENETEGKTEQNSSDAEKEKEKKEDKKEEEEEITTPVPLGEFMSDIKLRITVSPELVVGGKISKEDARIILQREYPEFSKDRTIMDYKKEDSTLVPVVKAAVKGQDYLEWAVLRKVMNRKRDLTPKERTQLMERINNATTKKVGMSQLEKHSDQKLAMLCVETEYNYALVKCTK